MEMAMAIGERVEKEGMQSMGDVLERSIKQEGHKDRVCLRQLEEIWRERRRPPVVFWRDVVAELGTLSGNWEVHRL